MINIASENGKYRNVLFGFFLLAILGFHYLLNIQ